MKTNQSIKANLAIIILMIVSAFLKPTIVRAETLKSLKLSFMTENNLLKSTIVSDEQETPLNIKKLEWIAILVSMILLSI